MNIAEVLDAQIEFLRTLKKAILADRPAPVSTSVSAGGPTSGAPAADEFPDIWHDRVANPSLFHPDLRARSQTWLKTCFDGPGRVVAGVPQKYWLTWRQPPGWYATDAQHAQWLAEHPAAPTDTGGTVAGPA